MTLKQLTHRKKVKLPSHHATLKNETKLAWWWWDLIKKNTTNQDNHARGVVVLGVSLDCVASEVLYLQWFLCGELISDGPAETRYFIFMIKYRQFPENGQRQISYISNLHQS